MSQQQYRAVNWVDGMKISRRHFLESDHYHTDQIRQGLAVTLTAQDYGLCAYDGNSLDVQVMTTPESGISVRVNRCLAVAPEGSRLEVSSEDDVSLVTSLAELSELYRLNTSQDQEFYIVLSVNLFERVPAGNPDEDEIPFRHPYLLPRYTLKIVPVGSVNPGQWGRANLAIGKLVLKDGVLKREPGYIPPARSINGFAMLKSEYDVFQKRIQELENHSVRILHKIKTKSQKNTLSDSVYTLADRIVGSISTGGPAFRLLIPDQPPVALHAYLQQLAQDIRTALICLTEREKEELLAYLAEWADETPGNIEKQVQTAVRIPFSQLEIAAGLSSIGRFVDFWIALLDKLSQLEFIGKRKGQQVFIVESPVHDPPVQPEKPKSRWSPI